MSDNYYSSISPFDKDKQLVTKDYIDALNKRLYDLETENTIIRSHLKKLDVLSTLDDLKTRVDLIGQEIASKLDIETYEKNNKDVNKKEFKVYDMRINELFKSIENLDFSVVKMSNLSKLFEPSYSNEFLPKLKENINHETSTMKEEITKKVVGDIEKSLRDSKEYIELKFESVNSKIVGVVNDSLSDKLGGIESTNTYLRSSIATLDSQFQLQQEQIDKAWSRDSKGVENLSSKERLMEEFKREFTILDKNISKLASDHKELSDKTEQQLSELQSSLDSIPNEDVIHSKISSEVSLLKHFLKSNVDSTKDLIHKITGYFFIL